ncbi:MAG: TIGR04282 family arsenosugar biosynthesis glycosyltransferase [Pseudomonadota bacterium]|nr:TIGR04282 family arsenosugar biosynthesis glycosyltransferase [Pseudomonadota bacterium]
MAKEPRLGAVKTRLARGVGPAAAMRFYRSATRNLILRVGTDPRWRTILSVAPDGALMANIWPRNVARIRQGRGDLGQRMQRVFDRLPPGPVVIVGTDIPEISAARVNRAFRSLGRHDIVIGPCEDGGYWLIGMKRIPRKHGIFGAVRWSSPHALADTCRNLIGLRVAKLEQLEDVDDEKSHRRLAGSGACLLLPPWWLAKA